MKGSWQTAMVLSLLTVIDAFIFKIKVYWDITHVSSIYPFNVYNLMFFSIYRVVLPQSNFRTNILTPKRNSIPIRSHYPFFPTTPPKPKAASNLSSVFLDLLFSISEALREVASTLVICKLLCAMWRKSDPRLKFKRNVQSLQSWHERKKLPGWQPALVAFIPLSLSLTWDLWVVTHTHTHSATRFLHIISSHESSIFFTIPICFLWEQQKP